MVTTRRKAAALNEAQPLQTTKTTRRTRSKAAASPLKALETSQPAPKSVKGKRKRNAATPEPVADESDEEGLFFKQSMPQISSTPNPCQKDVLIAPQEDVQRIPPELRSSEEVYRNNEQLSAEVQRLRYEILDLRNENAFLRERLDVHIARELTRERRDAHLAGQANEHDANQPQPTADYDSFMGNAIEPTPAQAEFITGSESALALLHHIESAAREPRTIAPSDTEEQVAEPEPAPPSPQAEPPAQELIKAVTPSPSLRAFSQPSGFFSRSFSAIKSRLGFSTTNPEPAPTPSKAPPPNTITEALSAPPTPVGERKQATHKKKRQSAMMRLLTKGVDSSDIKDAEEWAKHVIPTLKNDADFEAKRTRLETPVLVKDLNNFPSSKPWESGFGDPLGDLDDDEVVPVWAVYLDILAEADEPRKKKTKTSHNETMDVDDTQSLNDMFSPSTSTAASPDLHDSHGHSASYLDLHPRRSVEPSPMFGSPLAHKQGGNIFRERQGQEAIEQLRAEDHNALLEATKQVVPHHDPTQGSFGLDYDSDEGDTTISEIIDAESDGTASAPLWTQPPPPAPVPAHAPLPGASATDSVAVATTQQPVDEVERQRQKLMKHTPAKPSRLREAFVPSPSLMSDAGNESLFIASPAPITNLFDDMPDAVDLELDDDILAEVKRLGNTEEWKAEAAREWPDPIISYESDEEGLSPA
ncbi:hypothetical protein BKA63DRAFT_134119 [Paraphoma chrysanthemicola]|nr:hypothetical protein BKA63DRAFT_134119 [Paraphoma chrysanthemicola]